MNIFRKETKKETVKKNKKEKMKEKNKQIKNGERKTKPKKRKNKEKNGLGTFQKVPKIGQELFAAICGKQEILKKKALASRVTRPLALCYGPSIKICIPRQIVPFKKTDELRQS